MEQLAKFRKTIGFPSDQRQSLSSLFSQLILRNSLVLFKRKKKSSFPPPSLFSLNLIENFSSKLFQWIFELLVKRKVSVPLETFNFSLNKQTKLFLDKNSRVRGEEQEDTGSQWKGSMFCVKIEYISTSSTSSSKVP